ncbi:N-acetylmuramoyl-L-alanine amidase AmiC precursor [bacterium BMS3Bbin06]|nr:N-acetylmuramoyl-L-alanine amidase AmiC precursor [bacterium BMS3Bbin06]HDO35738.1 N-acetylmuramoyl-L-alanine amidase [Nitrospirota bacterium]HDY71969.1 N-acetylmuramoyl-L-alanine amidase [Nitrospirota bacterium]
MDFMAGFISKGFIRVKLFLPPGRLLLTLLLFASVVLKTGLPEALDSIEIKDIRFSVTNSRTRVVVELSGLPAYASHRLTSPERIYFDLKGVLISKKIKPLTLKNSVLKGIRVGQYSKGVARLVLELNGNGQYRAYTLTSPARLVIDIGNEENPFFRERKIVVIDPGHGGSDPGAISRRGLREKDVTLDIAKRLKRTLEEYYNLKVYLTRDRDRFISLDERTRFANRKDADLFVSIHSNASHTRKTRGFETYLLNWTNDTEALRVAARENRISVAKMKKSQSELGMILTSLERESKRDESLKLAHYIQRSLVSGLSGRYKRVINLGVKQALFYVLVGAEMPSVLVEVAFISNPAEERMLKSRKFRETSARGIASGIYRYILSLPDAPKLAMNR